MAFLNPYDITGNQTIDKILSGLGNMFTGGALDKVIFQQRAVEQEKARQAQLADLLSNPNIPEMQKQQALMHLSPEYLQANLDALSPDFQLKKQESESTRMLQNLQGQNYTSQIEDRRAGRNLEAEKFAADLRAKQAEQARIQQQRQALAQSFGGVSPSSLAMQGYSPAEIKQVVDMQAQQQQSQRIAESGLTPEEYKAQQTAQSENIKNADAALSVKDKVAQIRSLLTGNKDITGSITGANIPFTEVAPFQSVGRLFNTENQQNRDLAKSLISSLEADLTKLKMKGQGQITEGERAIIRNSLPNLSQEPETIDKILSALEREADATLSKAGIGDNSNKPQESQRLQYDPTTDSFVPKKKDEGAMNNAPSTEQFIKAKEGFSPVAYNDVAGFATTGYGHKITGNETTNDPNKLFQQDLQIATSAVDRLVNVPLSESQKTALASLVYNIGQGAFAKSTLLKKLNAGDYEGAVKEFERWNKAGGKEVKGLTNRRIAEANLFRGEA